MLGAARDDGAAKLDAIVYRAGAGRAFYVSEHSTSSARGEGFHACLANLARQVREDVEGGVYPPAKRDISRTFVTAIDVQLALRDGRRQQPFVCRIDETVDRRGSVAYEAQCPTNYLQESGRSIADAAARLSDVIAARYEGESITDLMRELPKRPMLTSFSLNGAPEGRQVCAAVRRENGGYEAWSLESAASAKGGDPFAALRNLEGALRKSGTGRRPVMSGEPVYCTLDVPLHLKEHTVIRRFFTIVSRYDGAPLPSYASRVPQAGLSLRSRTFDGALDAARDAIALEFREKSMEEVAQALDRPVILTAARVGPN